MARYGWCSHLLLIVQKFLSKYAVAAHLALLAVSPLFLFPYYPWGVVAEVVLWLSAFALAWVFMEPSRHADEMLHDARARVASEVLRDPLFWVMGILVLLAALRWINSGVELAFDTENMRWHMTDPTFAALPSAMAGVGKFEFAVALSAWIILIGIRHSLGRQARLSFVLTAASLAALAAVIAISLTAYDHRVALAAAKAKFLSPSFVGAVFGVYALAAVVALSGIIEARWKHFGWIAALAVGGTFSGAFLFAPAVSVLLYAAVAVFTAFLCMGWLGTVSKGVNSMRFFAILFIGVTLGVVIIICIAPDAIVESRIAEIKSLSLFSKDFFDLRTTLSKIATKTWSGAKWLGSGLGSFSTQTRFVADKADWKVIAYARPAAFNAWWHLLSERGLVGAITLAVPLGFLSFSIFRRIPLILGNRFFLPGFWLGFAVLGVAITENFYDVSFLRPEALLAIAAFLAISAGSLPPLKKKKKSESQDDDE